MGRGSLAVVISLAIHAAVLIAFLLVPGRGARLGSAASAPVSGELIFREEESEAPRDFYPEPPHVSLPPKRRPHPSVAPPEQGRGGPSSPMTGNVSKETQPAKGIGGAHGQARLFDVPVLGQRIIFLIDRSASMGPHGLLEIACHEVLGCAGRLPPITRFQIIIFNRTVGPLLADSPAWLEANPETLGAAERALDALQAEGSTEPGQALKFALSKQPDVLLFLTDAGDFRAELIREIRSFNRGQSAIHVLALHVRSAAGNDPMLEELARTNGGTFKRILISTTQPPR